VERPAGRLLWEPRGPWPTELLVELCAELDLVHVVDPMQTETVTPERTYYRPARHVWHAARAHRRRAAPPARPDHGRPSPYVLFNNLPRSGDAERFLALLPRGVTAGA
jgi:hypothetical protein